MVTVQGDGSITTSATYRWDDSELIELKKENDILKQRCAAHATPNICKPCQFTCSYRKKWGCSNRD